MKKLELKHLIPYADKGCNYSSREGTIIPFDCEDLADIQNHIKNYEDDTWQDNYKLHLNPLSGLTKEIEHNGEKFVPMEKLFDRPFLVKSIYNDRHGYHIAHGINKDDEVMITTIRKDLRVCEYWIIEKLFEWKFDVFGLIKNNLAIDKSTIK